MKERLILFLSLFLRGNLEQVNAKIDLVLQIFKLLYHYARV